MVVSASASEHGGKVGGTSSSSGDVVMVTAWARAPQPGRPCVSWTTRRPRSVQGGGAARREGQARRNHEYDNPIWPRFDALTWHRL